MPDRPLDALDEKDRRRWFFYQLVLVRCFEERALELFDKGELFGTTHAYIGQEANAVAVLNHLREVDIVVSNHRCHGHYLVRTGDVVGLMAELMGKIGGVCGGRGGSQHLHRRNFYSNGILGSTLPIAAGMAFAEKQKGTGAITVIFVGDGAFGEGVVYETLNMISLWEIPLLIVVENNRYAQSTPIELNFAGRFGGRAEAFGISTGEIESTNVEELYDRFRPIIQSVREHGRPHMEVINTYRLCGHSKGDDFRPDEEIELWRARDPLKISGESLDKRYKRAAREKVLAEIEEAETSARSMDFARLGESQDSECRADQQ